MRPLNYLEKNHEVLGMFLNRSVQYIKAMGVNESVESYDNKKVIEFPFGRQHAISSKCGGEYIFC